MLLSLISKFLSSNQSIVIETNFSLESDIKKAKIIMANNKAKVIEIYLTASKSVLMERVVSRWESGSRHESHSDSTRYKDIENYIDRGVSVPLNVGHQLIRIDTSTITIDELKESVIEQLGLGIENVSL